MAKKYDISNTYLYRKTVELTHNGQWPLYTVSPDEFLEASRDLIQLSDCANSKTIDGQKIPVEAYSDRITEATIKMLACLRRMEMEASSREMEAKCRFAQTGERDIRYIPAQEFVKGAKLWLYEFNNRACDTISYELEEKGQRPQYVDIKNEKTFETETQKKFAKDAARSHEEAMRDAYAEIDNLIEYGLPSTSAFGKVKDAFMLSDAKKANNQTIVDKILRSETDIETVRMYIIPALEQRILENYTYSLMERDQVQKSEIDSKWPKVSDPTYFKRAYDQHVAALKEIQKAIKTMEEREKAMAGDYSLEVRKAKHGQLELIGKYTNHGKEVLQDETKKSIFGLNKHVKRTKEKNNHEKEIVIKLGKTSRKFYEEIRKQAKKVLGYDSRRSLTGEKKRGLARIFSIEFWRRSSQITRKSAMTGKKEYSAKREFRLFKMFAKGVYTNDGKDKTLIGVDIEGPAAEIHFEKKGHLISGGTSAHVAQATAEAIGVKATAKAGGVKYDTKPDLVGHIKNEVFEHAVGNGSPIQESAQKFFDESKENLTRIKTTDVVTKVDAFGINILKAERKDGAIKTENRIPEIQNAANQAWDGIKEFGQQVGDVAQDIGETAQLIGEHVVEQVQHSMSQIEQAYNDMQLGIQDEITEGEHFVEQLQEHESNHEVIQSEDMFIEAVDVIQQEEIEEEIEISGR